MKTKLKALVLGSGFAGKGHTAALRSCGVEIAGIVGRNESVVTSVAADLHIPYSSTNWDEALETVKPDILAVGTPGGAHYGPIMTALEYGCHVFCDKPLASTAEEAREMYSKALHQDVKTAYAASYRYQPHALFAKELIAEGTIGEPLEVECISHYNLNPLIPFGWSHQMALGGGRLNNNFTHKLSIVLHILDGTLLSIKGEARNDMPKAPIVPGSHDFREREEYAPSPEEAAALQWENADAEWTYTVLSRVRPGLDHHQPVSVLFKHSGLQPRYNNDYIAFYAKNGAVYIDGAYAQGPLYLYTKDGGWKKEQVPAHINRSLPDIDDDTQRNWTQLAKEFTADILGNGYSGYQTFKDGWIFQEAIEAVRTDHDWRSIPQSVKNF